MADVARSHGGDAGGDPPLPPWRPPTGSQSRKVRGKSTNQKYKQSYEKQGKQKLPVEFDFMDQVNYENMRRHMESDSSSSLSDKKVITQVLGERRGHYRGRRRKLKGVVSNQTQPPSGFVPQHELDALKAQVETLKAQVETLKAQVETMKAWLETMIAWFSCQRSFLFPGQRSGFQFPGQGSGTQDEEDGDEEDGDDDGEHDD